MATGAIENALIEMRCIAILFSVEIILECHGHFHTQGTYRVMRLRKLCDDFDSKSTIGIFLGCSSRSRATLRRGRTIHISAFDRFDEILYLPKTHPISPFRILGQRALSCCHDSTGRASVAVTPGAGLHPL